MHRYDRFLRVLSLLLIFIVAGSGVSVAADKQSGKKKNHAEMMREVQEFKIKYILQEAEITQEQQPEFVKLYTEMSNAKIALFRQYRDDHKALKAKPSPTDEEYDKVSAQMAGVKSAEGAIDQSYYIQFKKLLTPRQLYLMKAAEFRFNNKMMHMRRNKK